MKTKDPDEELITAMGKKLPDRAYFRTVINLHDEAVNKAADRATAHAKRAIALCFGIHSGELDSSDVNKCMSDIDEAIIINKNLLIVQIAEGCFYYYCKKDFGKAIARFEKAAEMYPESYEPLFYKAMVYKATANWAELPSLLARIDRFDVQNPLHLTNLGLCYEYLYNYDRAIDYHQKAIIVNASWEAAYLNKFRTLLLKGSLNEARDVLQELIKILKSDHIEYQIILDMYEGKYPQAFDKAINASNSDFAFVGVRSLYLGNISKMMNKKADKYFDHAVKELNLELNANPDNAEIHSLVGLAYSGKGSKLAAVTEGEDAIKLAAMKNNKILESEMNLNLAEIYTRLGMFDDAIVIIKDAFKNHSLFSTKILQHDPCWKPLLSNPEIKKII
jgi:tetratricopeptide (TPR) repeat protein